MADQDLGTTIKFSVDATGVEAGTTRVKRSLQDIGKAASDVGKQTGNSIGAGGDDAAKKIEAATRRISNEFKRLQVDAESAGKTLSEKLVIKADAYGIPRAAIADQLASLKAFEAAQRATNPAMIQFQKLADQSGQSVAGLNAALRQVPAQFTDIVVSLQGGQKPLTVLLQQGGQLKDAFGGVGNAARALGGYVASLINPFSLAAGAVGTLGYAYFAGSKELDEYRKALVLTGNSVGLTSGQMQDMARSMAAVGGTQTAASNALVAFVNAGAAGSESLQKFAQSALNFEKVTGQAVEETAKQFAELGKNPLEASVKLNESTNFLTMSLYEQIKALEEQGKKTEAANVAQQAYSDTLNQNTAQITANLGTIEKGWNAIASATKGAWDWMKNIGRDDGPTQKLAKLQLDVVNAENNLKSAIASSIGGAASGKAQAYQKDLEKAEAKLAEFNKATALAQIRATDRGIEAQAVKDRIEWDKTHQSQLDKLQQSLHKEVEDYAKLKAAGKDDAQTRLQYEQRIHHLVKQEADYLKGEYKTELKTTRPKAESVERFGKELSATKEWLATQERMLKDSYSTQQKDLEDSFKAQEITAAQYYARQLASDAESLQQREQIRAEAQARFDAEMAKRVAVTQTRPESKAKSTALADLENEAKNFAAAQEAARQKDINSMAKHSNSMALEIDKESKKVTGSVDAYIADMQRKAEADAKLLAAREAMAGQAPEIIAGMEAELKVRADAAKILDQTAEAYALAAKNARDYESELQAQYDSGKEVTTAQIRMLEELKAAAVDSRLALVKLGGAVDTSAVEASITATAASIKKQTDEVAKEVQKTLADGIMSAGKDGGAGLRKALEDVLVTKPFRIVVEAMLQPVSSAIAQGIMGQSIGGVAGATGFQTALNTASLAMSTFGSSALGAAKAVTMSGASLSSALTTGAELIGAGEVAAGSGMIAGAAFPAVAAAVAAKAIFDSMQGSVTPTGTFLYGGQGRFGGRQDFAQSGGLFGGGDTKNSSWFDPAPEVAKYMGAVEQTVITSVKGWAQAIGLSAEAVDSYSKQVEVSIGGLDAKGVQEAIGKAFAGMADDIAQTKFGDFLLPLAKSGETLGATLQRLGTDLLTVNNVLRDLSKPLFDATTQGVQDMESFLSSLGGLEKFTQLANTLTTVNSVLAGFNKTLFDTSVEGAQAAKSLVDSVGGLDRFSALSSNLESVNNVLMDLGQSTFDLSVEGAEAAAALSRSVGGTDKITKLASELLQVNENLAKLGQPLLDISVASAQAAHGMLKATDMAVAAQEAAERLEASYASFAKNLSKDPDTTQVASLQAIFDRAMDNVTKFIPSIKGQSDLTSVTYDQYTSFTDPQRTKLDAAASAFKDLQNAINSAAKSAESAAKTAKDAADAAVKAYSDALKAIEKDTRNVNRELADFGKTDFQKKLAKIGYDSQDKLAELDELSAKAAELSATASGLSMAATKATIDTVNTISTDLMQASIDLVDNSAEVAGNVSTTLHNSVVAFGDALDLVPAISTLFNEILKGLQKIPLALTGVSASITGVGNAASGSSNGLTAFSMAAVDAGRSAGGAVGQVTSVGTAFNAVTPAASAAGAALNALGAAFDTASTALNGLAGTFNAASASVDGLNAAFASAATGLGSLTSAITSTASAGASLAGSFGSISGALSDISSAASSAVGSISSAASAFSSVAGAAASVQVPVSAPVVVAAAAGGAIHGPGTSTSDSVPAMLSDGEYVIKASSVDKYGLNFLNALNAGTLKSTIYRSTGGTVDANAEAQRQSAYQDRFSSLLDDFGGAAKTFAQVTQDLSQFSIQGLDSAGVKKFFLDLLQNNQPGADGKFSASSMAVIESLDTASASIGAYIKLLDEQKQWQDKFNVLTGKSTDRQIALQNDLASTTDATTQALIRQVYAQEDFNKAAKATAEFNANLLTAGGPVFEKSAGVSAGEFQRMADLGDTFGSLQAATAKLAEGGLTPAEEATQNSIVAMHNATITQYDLNKAREKEIAWLTTTTDKLKSLTDTFSGQEVDLNRAMGNETTANTLQKTIDLTDVRKAAADAQAVIDGTTFDSLSTLEQAALKLTVSAAAAAEKQYDLNEARKQEIALLGNAKSRLQSLTDASATKQVERKRLLGDTEGADAAQEAIDLADVYKSTAEATALLATEGLTPLDKAAIQATITTNEATIAQYQKNAALDKEIEVLKRYQSVKDDAESTNIELLRAMGQTANAAALELAKATQGFDAAQIATYRQTQATKGLIAAYGNLSNTANMVTNSRIGLLTAKGDTTGAAALQRELDIAPYVKVIADSTIELGKATTETEKDTIRLTIAKNNEAIGNYDLSKSLDKEAQAANDAKTAADGLAQAYADMKSQIEQAKVALLRASGDTTAADELEFAIATREHEGDVYYATLQRELVTLRKLTEARQQLNTLEDSALQNQIKLKRAQGEGVLANALERSAFLQNAALPAAQAKAELDRANMGFVPYAETRGLSLAQLNAAIPSFVDKYYTFTQSSTANQVSDTLKGFATEPIKVVLAEFASMQRTDAQKASLQNVVDTSAQIAAAYDRNKALESELKIIELQDEAYKQSLDAQKAVSDAQKNYADVLKSTIETMRDFIATLDGGASPLQNLSTARQNFNVVANRAASGDTSAYKDLTPAARAFLDLSKNYSRSIQDYQRDEARVRATLNAVIKVNQSELDKLPKEIAEAADPTKQAWTKLQEAINKQTNSAVMLDALQVDQEESKRRLRTAEETLSDRYIEAVYLLDETKKTSLLDAFNTAVKSKVDETTLPDYSEVFNLGDIWGTKIAGVLPKTPLTNEQLNALIATKFPGLLPSDFVTALTPAQLSELVSGKFPTLTTENLVGVPADMVKLVNEKLAGVLPPGFAGEKFDAKAMMQAAIDNAMGGIASAAAAAREAAQAAAAREASAAAAKAAADKARYDAELAKLAATQITQKTADTTTNVVNTVQTQGLSGGTSSTGTSFSALSATQAAAMLGADTATVTDAAKFTTMVNKYENNPGLVSTLQAAGVDMKKWLNDANAYGAAKGFPGFAVGTNNVPKDMLAQIHEGEVIIPEPFNPERYNRASGNTALVDEIKALRAEVSRLREEQRAGNNAIAANTRKTAQALTKFDTDGMPETRDYTNA